MDLRPRTGSGFRSKPTLPEALRPEARGEGALATLAFHSDGETGRDVVPLLPTVSTLSYASDILEVTVLIGFH